MNKTVLFGIETYIECKSWEDVLLCRKLAKEQGFKTFDTEADAVEKFNSGYRMFFIDSFDEYKVGIYKSSLHKGYNELKWDSIDKKSNKEDNKIPKTMDMITFIGADGNEYVDMYYLGKFNGSEFASNKIVEKNISGCAIGIMEIKEITNIAIPMTKKEIAEKIKMDANSFYIKV